MKEEVDSRDSVMHNEMSDLWFWERKMREVERWRWEMKTTMNMKIYTDKS